MSLSTNQVNPKEDTKDGRQTQTCTAKPQLCHTQHYTLLTCVRGGKTGHFYRFRFVACQKQI